MAITPAERSEIARIAAHTRWSKETNRAGVTAKARNNSPASIQHWLRKVDPESKLPHAERLKLAESAMKAHFLKRARDMRAAKKRKAEGAA
jgi:hypothetical protein